jgi:ribosomal protein S18 acetylase RimI-like enzyme
VSRNFALRVGGPDDVERLAPLWRALRDHHATLPNMTPVRSFERSWAKRSGQYREWLAGDDHTLLLAERDGEPIGYAMVSVSSGGPATWDVGEKSAEVETLSILDSERGSGVGKALMDAAAKLARESGAGAVFVGVAHTNDGALRFYEREGYRPFYAQLVKTLD